MHGYDISFRPGVVLRGIRSILYLVTVFTVYISYKYFRLRVTYRYFDELRILSKL